MLCFALSAGSLALADDWPSYGGDNGSQKYMPFDQINKANVSTITNAWNWQSSDNATVAENFKQENYLATPAGYKATPIVVNGTMYVPTSFGRIAALDAQTGAEKWVFDTKAWEAGGVYKAKTCKETVALEGKSVCGAKTRKSSKKQKRSHQLVSWK